MEIACTVFKYGKEINFITNGRRWKKKNKQAALESTWREPSKGVITELVFFKDYLGCTVEHGWQMCGIHTLCGEPQFLRF